MRADQIRRYARHILLPEVGGIGQAQLLAATARIDGDGLADTIAAAYLAAGGVGHLAIGSPAVCDALIDRNPDTRIAGDAGTPIAIPARPAWWPAGGDTDVALAWWQGGLAATRWLAETCAR